ncbi:glycerophosphodiester phosphodiesterase [Paenarthrobacter sp. NPDC092416]|uniref:glycerophosphodiester phosphodiesterase n=1 Tax=Paenarthrobacter sp. NPDC092416 TaxID=3364386 RepID=UPI0038028751
MMIEIQGHRGVLATRHGNTLASFVEALRLGVDAIEVDIWLTSDGQLALRHDAVIDDVDIRRGALREAVVEKCPDTSTDVDVETRTPTLAEALALMRFADATNVVLDIEVKTDGTPWDEYGQSIVAALAAVLRVHQHEQALRVRSFDPQVIRAMADELRDIPLVALSRANTGQLPGLYPSEPETLIKAALATGASAVAPEFSLLDGGLVAAAHAAGLKVYPWTLTSDDQIRRAVHLGVDGVCVNDVALARDTLAGLDRVLPPACPILLPFLQSVDSA